MSDMPKPRVSILIPNFNNGAQSSKDGTVNLILDLLQSLQSTLATETIPFEILVYDDGSDDDSLETLRKWAKKKWRNGQPFLTMTEDKHCGILAITANKLSRMAKGDILARLDGDVVCLTPNWVSKLVDYFEQGIDHLGVIGPKQLKPNLGIHAYGDFILHPNGYTHVANSMPRDSVKRPLEVDHVMGCFYCCKKEVFDDLGGYDEDFLRGQTIDFGLRARKAGWRTFAVPDIEFIHNHVKREDRNTRADTQEGLKHTIDVFERKWGFSRLAPDMALIAEKYAGSPLLWNKLYFGDKAYKPRQLALNDIDFKNSEWSRYTHDEAFQKKINLRVKATLDVVNQSKVVPEPFVIIGIGDGLVTHLLASQGGQVVAFDDRQGHVDFANRCTLKQQYPQHRPMFKTFTAKGKIDLPDASVDQILIDRLLERHPNPTPVLKEAARILKPRGFLVVASDRKYTVANEDPSDPATLFRLMTIDRKFLWLELVNLVQGVGGFELAIDIFKDNRSRDMVLIMRRLES
ncbi:MAG: glycosyltransferase [Phycisphaeraceae bacterium]|nr:glycosyltransferase [Phycisphaeraceae bacterium]